MRLDARALREAGRPWCYRCGQSIAGGERSSPCVECRGEPAVLDGVIRLGEFAGDLAALLKELKYGGNALIAEKLGAELGAAVLRFLPKPPPWLLITSIPGAPWRRWHRGVDHASELAGAVGRRLGQPTFRLLRHAGGAPRSGRTRAGRQRRRMTPRPFDLGAAAGRTILVVDDILTSGATMREAGRLLRPLEAARTLAVVVAVTPRSGRRKINLPKVVLGG